VPKLEEEFQLRAVDLIIAEKLPAKNGDFALFDPAVRQDQRFRQPPPICHGIPPSGESGCVQSRIAIIPLSQSIQSGATMAMTLTEKILGRAAGHEHVVPGENIWVNVDVLLTHDVCGPGTFGIFHQHFGKDAKVWDREKVVIVPDHYIFTADAMANRN